MLVVGFFSYRLLVRETLEGSQHNTGNYSCHSLSIKIHRLFPIVEDVTYIP